MKKLSDIKLVWEVQRQMNLMKDRGLERDLLHDLPLDLKSHALIVSGIRRCGKSTLMRQIISRSQQDAFFLNFDTPQLFGFEMGDFELLDAVIQKQGVQQLFFDEIQVVGGWELYVRQKLDEGYQVTITGSNASLLSRELGTKLTGRHVTKELFPFSFAEYLRFHGLDATRDGLYAYMRDGGFPEYVKSQNADVLLALFDDIIYRDIAVRYGIRDVRSLKSLLLYLVANIGNLVTASKLTQILGIKSAATVLDYFSFFEQSYLIHLMPKFSYSYRSRLVNPRKIYFIDPALAGHLSVAVGRGQGHLLENMVYWELCRRGWNLYYWNEGNGECDFVVCKGNVPEQLIQVCYELNAENQEREVKGLVEAMKSLKIDQGLIVTYDQTDLIKVRDKRIDVVPASVFLK